MQIQLRVNQYAILTVSPVDDENNPAPIDGAPIVELVSGDATSRITPAGEILLIPADTKGKSVFKIRADAKEGEEVEFIETEIELDAIAQNAVALNVGFTLGNKKDLPPIAPAVPA